MNKDKRNNIKLLGTLNNADESGIIANANQIYDANENKSTQDVSKEHTERIKTLEVKENSMQTTLENITKTGEASAASNVTYNHNDSKLDATNVQQAIDEVSSIGHFAKRGGIVNISTNYNSTNTAEVLTLKQAIAKVPSNDRVLGFQGKYLASDGWHTIIYISDSLTSWSDITKWIDLADKILRSISKNATFAGIAIPTTNPGTPDGPVFYLAAGPGVFFNFGITLSILECAVFLWNGVSWIKKTISFSTLEAFKYITSASIYNLHGYIGTDGSFKVNDSYRATDFIPFSTNAPILIDHAFAGNSSLIIAFYDKSKAFISGINNATSVNIPVEDIPKNAKYIRCGTSLATSETAVIINISIVELGIQIDELGIQIDELETQIDELETQIPEIKNLKPTLDLVGYYNLDGILNPTSNAKNTGLIPIKGYTKLEYQAYISETGIAVSFWNKDREYIPSLSIIGTNVVLTSGTIDLTQSKYDDAKYIAISYYDATGAYSKYKCIISNENSLESRVAELESKEFTSVFLPSKDDKLSILIFGDSITDCASITIDSITNTTTAYSLRHPANSYTDSKGQLIRFDMWPYLITQYLNCFDLRNYAKSGASYKYSKRETEDLKRQNLSYQIEVAINDINNPNGIFPTKGQFSPDIIIFALGTNDGSPNDTFDSAMAKTIMDKTGTSFDIEATLSNLDLSKFCEAARYAFLTIKKQFPYALCICVLPIQRASSDIQQVGINSELKKMAERYSIKVIDGASEMGIVRDLETNGGLGTSLKDGLHPNEKGQNLYARLVINAIKNNWLKLSLMNEM